MHLRASKIQNFLGDVHPPQGLCGFAAVRHRPQSAGPAVFSLGRQLFKFQALKSWNFLKIFQTLRVLHPKLKKSNHIQVYISMKMTIYIAIMYLRMYRILEGRFRGGVFKDSREKKVGKSLRFWFGKIGVYPMKKLWKSCEFCPAQVLGTLAWTVLNDIITVKTLHRLKCCLPHTRPQQGADQFRRTLKHIFVNSQVRFSNLLIKVLIIIFKCLDKTFCICLNLNFIYFKWITLGYFRPLGDLHCVDKS